MFAYLLLIAAFLPSAPPAPADIVVTAQRVKDWRGKASMKSGETRCRTAKTTGDKDLDQIACDSMRYCMMQATPEVGAIMKLPKAERDRRFAGVNQRLASCGEEQHQLRVADLLEKRWAARRGETP